MPTSTIQHKEHLRLVEIVLEITARFIYSTISPKLRSDVQVRDFTRTNDYETFLQACYTCAANTLSLQPTAHSKNFIETLQGYMPLWTPPLQCQLQGYNATLDTAIAMSILQAHGI